MLLVRSSELRDDPPLGDSALARLGWGAAEKDCTPPLYDENAFFMLKGARLGGDLLLLNALLPPVFCSGDLDREVKGEVFAFAKEPMKASKPVRLVAVLAGACCDDHCEEAKPANGEGARVLLVNGGEGDGDGEIDSFLDELELAPEKMF